MNGDRGRTHWAGCEEAPGHHACALARLAEARTDNERLRAIERQAAEQSAYIQAHGLTEIEVAALRAANDRLRIALADAIACIDEWGAYASPHIHEKWSLAGDLARLRQALAT